MFDVCISGHSSDENAASLNYRDVPISTMVPFKDFQMR